MTFSLASFSPIWKSALWLAVTLCWFTGCAHSPRTAEPVTLRVMTYNIHHGAGLDGRLDTARIAGLILEQRADIVALQEVDRGVARTDGRDLAVELAEQTGMFFVFGKNLDHQGGAYGNAILSRFPVVESSNLHLPVVNEGEQRGLIEAVLDVRGRRLAILNTHLDYRSDDAERRLGVEVVRQAAAARATMPVIVCGDFNDVPGSETHRRMAEDFLDVWETAGEGDGFTIPVRQARRRIDFIFIGRGSPLRLIRAWVPYSEASDHLPVVAELRW